MGREPRLLPEPPPADIAEQAQEFVGRDWVGDRIADWLKGSASVLLITGEPGSGKTMIAAQAVTVSRGEAFLSVLVPGFLDAAHFCRQIQTESVDPVSIWEHVSGQLAGTVPGYLEIVGLFASQNQSNITVGRIDQQVQLAQNSTVVGIQIRFESPDPRLAYLRLIRRPLRRLQEEGRLTHDVVILIDGLDETAEGATGTPFIALLARELAQHVSGLRLCLTSRPGKLADRIAQTADGFGGCERLDLIANQPAAIADVNRYVEHRLSSLDLSQASRLLSHTIADAANGNFLYARVVVDDVARQTASADGYLPLPADLAGIYASYIDRELSLNDKAWEQRYRPVLGALVQSREDGLTPRHLQLLTGLPQPVIDDALGACMPYLHCGVDAMRPYHESFREYLRADGRHHTYPGNATQAIVTNLSAPWIGRWQECSDKYILRNLAAHIGDLLQLGDDQSVALANKMLSTVVADPAFRHAAARAAGEAKLIIDLDRIDLDKAGHTIHRRAGEVFFLRNGQADDVLLIKRGHIKILHGKPPRLMAIRGPGDIIGEMGPLRRNPRTASAIAYDDVEALIFPAASWLNFLRDHPRSTHALLGNIHNRLASATSRLGQDLTQQVAGKLAELANSIGEYRDKGIIIRLTQRDLTDIIATSNIDSIREVIQELSAREIIRPGHGTITILDLDALNDITGES